MATELTTTVEVVDVTPLVRTDAPTLGQVLERKRIEHIPATVIQGRYDMICPPVSAWKLAQGWDHCDLRLVSMAGHALSEPGISEALVRAMDGMRALA